MLYLLKKNAKFIAVKFLISTVLWKGVKIEEFNLIILKVEIQSTKNYNLINKKRFYKYKRKLYMDSFI